FAHERTHRRCGAKAAQACRGKVHVFSLVCRLAAQLVEKICELGWQRSAELEWLAGAGMGEVELGGMEKVAFEFERLVGRRAGCACDVVRRAVERVADDGVTEGLHMDSNLVRAASLDADFEKREAAVRAI